MADTSSVSAVLGFAGLESPGTYTYQAFNLGLSVTYNHRPAVAVPNSPSPPNGGSFHQLGYEFAAISSDADGDPLQYNFKVATDAGMTNLIAVSGWQSGDTYTYTYIFPTGYWNTTLYWNADVFDGYAETAANYVWSFKPAPPVRG